MTAGFAPEALFFDMDGLLLDTERVGSEAFVAITAPFGVDEERARVFYASLVGTSSASTRDRVADFVPGADIDDLIEDWHATVNRLMDHGVPLRPFVRETVYALAEQGRRMAVVTSTRGDRARDHLDRADLLKPFETVVAGDEVKANKPDPAPYLEAAARLSVTAASCVAFEDSDHGVAAAVAAGCVTVQIPDLRPEGLALPVLGQRVAGDLASAVRALGLIA